MYITLHYSRLYEVTNKLDQKNGSRAFQEYIFNAATAKVLKVMIFLKSFVIVKQL